MVVHQVPTLTSETLKHVPAPAEKLLAAFKSGWHVVLHQVPPSADMASSALQPFLVAARREGQGPAGCAPPVGLGSFRFQPSAANADQVEDVMKVGGCRVFHRV